MDPSKSLWIDNSDGAGPFRNPALTDEEFDAGLEEMKNTNIDALWAAATAYEKNFISNGAYSIVTKGSIRSLPKCLAVEAWINHIWNDFYYPRKALTTYQWDATLYDFSPAGPMPYTVPELIAEVYA